MHARPPRSYATLGLICSLKAHHRFHQDLIRYFRGPASDCVWHSAVLLLTSLRAIQETADMFTLWLHNSPQPHCEHTAITSRKYERRMRGSGHILSNTSPETGCCTRLRPSCINAEGEGQVAGSTGQNDNHGSP
jgi:hypothetical protein